MASKRKSTVVISDDEDDYELPKKKPQHIVKAKAAKAEVVEVDDADDDEVKVKVRKAPAAKAAAKKPAATAEPSVIGGWNIVPPSLLWREYGKTEPTAKIAAFDLDGTLVHTKSHRTFAANAEDWRWFNKKVVAAVKEQRDKGFKIVVISNQNGIKSALTGKMSETVRGKMDHIAKELGPLQVFMATQQDDLRKPGVGLWKYMVENCNGGIQPDLSESFYVGDAAGRPEDFANTDREFAAAVGIKFLTPEELFGAMEGKGALPPAAVAVSTAPGAAAANPDNQALVDTFKALADAFFANKEMEKATFKGIAARKAAAALASYSVKLTTDNYKQAKKLPGVGDGSLKFILEFLETGKVQALEDMTGGGGEGGGSSAAGGGPSTEAKAKAAAKAEESLQFA